MAKLFSGKLHATKLFVAKLFGGGDGETARERVTPRTVTVRVVGPRTVLMDIR